MLPITTTLFWILGFTFLMSLIAWIGIITLVLKEKLLKKILLFLVAFSAGSLLGGAFLHLIPEALFKIFKTKTFKATLYLIPEGLFKTKIAATLEIFLWVLLGFSTFFLLEQFLHWHHCHKVPSEHKKPMTYLILIADGLHNFLGGLAIGGSFLSKISTGIVTWIACATHEIPQELGDFGVLVHGGWRKQKALWFNFFSALTIIPGGILAYFLHFCINIDTTFLLPFAAGNFIYISSSDLIPEIKHEKNLRVALLYFLTFSIGILLLLGVKLILQLPK